MFQNENVKDRVFLVTGAGGGIGRKLVEALLERWGFVVACDVNEGDLLALADEFRTHQDRLITHNFDITADEEWEKAIALTVKFAEDKKRKFYGLINCAGVLKPGWLSEVDSSQIDFHIDINVKGNLYGCVRAAAIFRRARDGHIINIASLAGVAAVPGIALYSASKFAVRGFTLALAEEMSEFGVNVTVVCPDAVQTGMLDLQLDYEEAALTFSGMGALTPQSVAEEICAVIGSSNREVLIPGWRGAMAKFSSALPEITSLIQKPLREMGKNFMTTMKNEKRGIR